MFAWMSGAFTSMKASHSISSHHPGGRNLYRFFSVRAEVLKRDREGVSDAARLNAISTLFANFTANSYRLFITSQEI
jgi:hypothetical protein